MFLTSISFINEMKRDPHGGFVQENLEHMNELQNQLSEVVVILLSNQLLYCLLLEPK